jgi:large subunit ribosomal protein L46
MARLFFRSLRRARGFSSSASSAAKEGGDGKLVASVMFERLPVVIPKIHPVVYAFQEFSYATPALLAHLVPI